MVRPMDTGRDMIAARAPAGPGPAVRARDTECELSGIHPASGLAYQVLAPDRLGIAPWRTLNAFSLTPAPFFDPVFLNAVAPFGGASTLRLMVVRDPAECDALKAVWPFSVSSAGGLGVVTTFSTHYSPLAVPIIARGRAPATIAAALAGFARLAPVLTIPHFPAASETGRAIMAAIGTAGLAHATTGVRERATLEGGLIFRDYVRKHWSRSRRNKVQRLQRRLSEIGTVTCRVTSAGAPWPDAGKAFLRLEALGWKGRAGTAMAAHHRSTAIIEDVCERMIPAGLAEIHTLRVDETPVAMLVLLRLRGHVLTWKIAYDEDWARYSPGHLLFAEVTRKIIARGDVHADSCANDDISIADPYWGQRMAVGTLHLAVRGGTAGMLGLGVSAAQAAATDVAKAAYRRVRGR